MEFSWSEFERALLDTADQLERTHQVPVAVWFGSTAVPPESYLAAVAQVCTTLISRSEPPAKVTVAPSKLVAAKYVAEDTPKLWDWPIFPRGFHSAQLMDLARLQAWTLKPAQLSPGR